MVAPLRPSERISTSCQKEERSEQQGGQVTNHKKSTPGQLIETITSYLNFPGFGNHQSLFPLKLRKHSIRFPIGTKKSKTNCAQ